MNLKLVKQESKDALKGIRFTMFLVAIVSQLIIGALANIGIGFLVAPVFTAGLFLVSKVVLKEKRVDFNLLFNYFKDLNHALKLLGVSVLTFLIVFAGFILLIIPGIIFSFQYSQALYIMAENPEMKIWDAMKKSKEIMIGHKWELFVFYLSFIGHYILAIITFGIYLIYFLPYIQVAMTNYYVHLTHQENISINDDVVTI